MEDFTPLDDRLMNEHLAFFGDSSPFDQELKMRSLGFLDVRFLADQGERGIQRVIDVTDLMNPWQNDDVVNDADDDEMRTFLSYMFINAGGQILLKSNSQGVTPVAYTFLDDVKRETYSSEPYFVEVAERANWDARAAYVRNVTPSKVTKNDLVHLDDFAVHQDYQGRGYGPLVVRHSLLHYPSDGKVVIGFADAKDPARMIACAKAGMLIGQHISPSPDGDHPSFTVMYSHSWHPEFTGFRIPIDPRADPNLAKLKNSVQSIVEDGMTVGYNRAERSLEIVTLKQA